MSGRGAVNTPPALPAVPSSARNRAARTTQALAGFTGAQNALIQRVAPTPVHPDLPGQYANSSSPRPSHAPSSLLEQCHAAIVACRPNVTQGWLRELALTEGAAGALPRGVRLPVCRRTVQGWPWSAL